MLEDKNKYTITLSPNQLWVLNQALEWYFRLQMGQFGEYTNEIARCAYKDDLNNQDHEQQFNAYIQRRNRAKDLFDMAFRTAQPTICPKTENMMVAEDMWAEIRYQMWKDRPEPKSHVAVDAYPPIHVSAEDSIRVEHAKPCIGDLPIEELNLTVSTYNGLKTAGINTIGELTSKHREEVLQLRRLGEKAMEEIESKLTAIGVSFADRAVCCHAARSKETSPDMSVIPEFLRDLGSLRKQYDELLHGDTPRNQWYEVIDRELSWFGKKYGVKQENVDKFASGYWPVRMLADFFE